jgi:hypothetical protein
MAGLLSRPPMNIVPAMIPHDVFMAAYNLIEQDNPDWTDLYVALVSRRGVHG